MKPKKPDPDYRERDAWIVANMAGVWPRALPECVAALKRRDLRERQRGIASFALACEPWWPDAAKAAHVHAGPAAIRWARRQR